MKWPNWRLSYRRGDWLPIFIGGLLLVFSIPAVLMLIFRPERGSTLIRIPLLVFCGATFIAGVGFIVWGIRLCSTPGSLAYRISHGRIFPG